MRFATRAIRVGQEPDRAFGAVVPPIYQSATYAWENLDTIPKFDYARCGNPNSCALEQALASLEGGNHCTVFASGMAAIGAVFSLLKTGDHLLVASDIYGGTHRLAYKYLPDLGIQATPFNASCIEDLQEKIQPNTRLLIFESPTNPNLRIVDIRAICAEARKHNIPTVFDNTFASPALQNPLELGVDIVVHSTTKYVTGHSDVIGGAVVVNDDALAQHIKDYGKAFGSCPSPFDTWLSIRGIKTLSLRMERHCENAQAIAEALFGHPRVAAVHYPGLITHPQHKLAASQMKGFGGMLAIEVAGTVEEARKVAESTKVFILAESLGGVESLIAYPPLMSHATMTEEQRVAAGIPPQLLRISVGIEDKDDLIEDLNDALASI